MRFVPYRKLGIQSAMSPQAAADALASQVGPARRRRGETARTFHGTLDGLTFNIQRNIDYRNSFLPVIRGTIDADPTGSVVSISMKLSPVVAAFSLFWFGFATLLCIGLLGFDLRSHTLDPVTLMPLGMLVFGWLLATLAFGVEAKKATEELARVFGAPGPAQPFR